MLQPFKASVIIPVYNAERYLRKAVESAVKIDSVGEIILVEDKSPDNALDLCKKLIEEYDKVKLFQHSDKGNHGAGASRNLGINRSTCDYIAFLDADDYYLPTRFEKDKELFEAMKHCEGVYNSVGTHFYSDHSKRDFYDKGFAYQEILTLTDSVPPNQLFSVLFSRHPDVKGEFHTNGITLKKEVFTKVGLFNTELRLRQDIHMWRRLAAFCNLYSGELTKPTSIRCIHDHNRMTKVKDHDLYIDLWWKSLKTEFKQKHLHKEKYAIFEQAYFNYYTGSSNKFLAFKSFIINTLKTPKMVKESNSNFDFNFWKVFGRNTLTLHAISFKNKIFK
jgi:glycosyltransferase involved in cell wall biosynthesis